ncbi:MAG: hypothetical protein WCY11_19455 [Novosphingobium sp.]
MAGGIESSDRGSGRRNSRAAGLKIACAVAVLAAPSAVLAFTTRFDGAIHSAATRALGGSADASRDSPRLAVQSLAQGRPFHFTPAGTPNRPDRSVTVAVRVDPQTVKEIIVKAKRGPMPRAQGAIPLQLAPSAFNLGVSRGYQSFAQSAAPKVEIRKIEMPDLASFSADKDARREDTKVVPRIGLDDRAPSGRSPRTFSGDGDDKVDLGGSLRVTRNLDVTAGVRYSQDRERLRPLTDGKQDNQAVYVGTQFRF